VVEIGVLALQGDFRAHAAVLAELGGAPRAVRTAAELEGLAGLVMPGGESTAMLRLMATEDLGARIRERVRGGMAVLATCAGVILLAETVTPPQPSLGLLAVDVVRNAYGRQPQSTVTMVELAPELGAPAHIEGVFIRAPRITAAGSGVEVLGRRGEDPVLVRQGRILGATFHPELAGDRRIHELFVRMGEDSQARIAEVASRRLGA
jgi:5'-phosphate synthase pdxT subunit